MQRGALSTILNSVVAICAVVVSVLLVRRELAGRVAGPRFAEVDWTEPFRAAADTRWLHDGGHVTPSPTTGVPLVRVVVFSDFQCPACKVFAEGALRGALAEFDGRLSVRHRHFPLSSHPLAFPAAVAAECAAREGLFAEYHDRLYESQAMLGRRSLVAVAKDAGVADIGSFEACLEDPAIDRIVAADIESGRRLEVRFTPTIFVDGRVLPGLPDSLRFHQIISRSVGPSLSARATE